MNVFCTISSMVAAGSAERRAANAARRQAYASKNS
jgi:hypothetical protein